jgi:hypothetical protein
MLEQLPELSRGGASHLNPADYLADFSARYRDISGIFWKLERRQEFREPCVPSWSAAAAGDWLRALQLIEPMRAEVAAEFSAVPGLQRRRIRIVERPVSPYLQWEMHVLRMRAEEGEVVRAVDAKQVRDHERRRPLPELVIIGGSVLYQILYTSEGMLAGALRSTDAGLIGQAAEELAGLFREGEDIESFFAREIAALPPPVRA